MNKSIRRYLSVFFAINLLCSSAMAAISEETLEKEHRARYYINYAGYLIDVGKYLEALESYEAAEEVTTISKTIVDARLAKATLLFSFLDAPEQALIIYKSICSDYPDAREVAQYRKGMLLYDLGRYDEMQGAMESYLKSFPTGRFQFQAETLIAKTPSPDNAIEPQNQAPTSKPLPGRITSSTEVTIVKPESLPLPTSEPSAAQAVALIPNTAKDSPSSPEKHISTEKASGKAEQHETADIKEGAPGPDEATSTSLKKTTETIRPDTTEKEPVPIKALPASSSPTSEGMTTAPAKLQKPKLDKKTVATVPAKSKPTRVPSISPAPEAKGTVALADVPKVNPPKATEPHKMAAAKSKPAPAKSISAPTPMKQADSKIEKNAKQPPVSSAATAASSIAPSTTKAPTPQRIEKRSHPKVRVRMCQTTKSARIQGKAICVSKIGCKDTYDLRLKNGKLLINGIMAESNIVTFKSDAPMKVVSGKKNKRVRGVLKAFLKNGKLMVVNTLDIEDYLLSVVPSENPASWPIETLKAQAVAARTYAYYQRQHRKTWAYDLVDFAGDQAYGGMDKEHKKSTLAVKATTGQILTHKDRPILAMYSANSGGHTADAKAVFNLHKPYLVAKQDPASLKGGMADWTRSFSVSKVIAALAEIKINAKGLQAIEAHTRGPSGRIVKVRLVLKNGKTKVLRNRTTLRRALKLPEILHKIRLAGDTFIFEGHGWGHGVGYSQWGSAHLGKTKKYDEILAFYYGAAKMKKYW